jgi:hypothetical protein
VKHHKNIQNLVLLNLPPKITSVFKMIFFCQDELETWAAFPQVIFNYNFCKAKTFKIILAMQAL